MRALFAFVFLIAFSPVAMAEPAPDSCTGKDLIAAMPVETRAALFDRAAAAPFHQGLFWKATKGQQTITLAGTFHLDDPRLDPITESLTPHLLAATTLMVEAGPEEERQLKNAIATSPDLLVLSSTTLPELLSDEDWKRLSKALNDRGFPSLIAAKLQPWYVSAMLGIPGCLNIKSAKPMGLDARLIQKATEAQIPIQPLEPFDTVFRIFQSIPLQDQIEMIRYDLEFEANGADLFSTIKNLYFQEKIWAIWELQQMQSEESGLKTDETVAMEQLTEQTLLTSRNAQWIPELERAASTGPVFAAFGALHLPGEDGVLYLLKTAGWTITPLELPPQ